MNQVMFTYNANDAAQAGQGSYISETGAYICKITEAKYVVARSGAQSVEFSIETEDGQKGQYISVWTQDKSGQPIKSGHSMINAIMGCTGVQQLTLRNMPGVDIAPELTNKRIGLVLQKVLKFKSDGSDTYSFEIRLPFFADSYQTIKEKQENAQPKAVSKLMETLKDRDERKKQNQQGQQTVEPDDGIPF